MKERKLSILTNAIICMVLIFVTIAGFYNDSLRVVSSSSNTAYYKGNNKEGVALMFNVYENSQNVYEIINTLNSCGETATFFIGGCWADDNVECVRAIRNYGYEIGSHGYFHKDHSKLSLSENMREIEPSLKLLKALCNIEVNLFAPPSGAFADNTLKACDKLKLKLIMWTNDTIDWRDSDVKAIVERATKDISGGELILMHPTDSTVKALPQIIKLIKENGLKTLTVSQCIGE